MTTKISFTIRDEIAETMNVSTPNIYLDVFGGVRLREGTPFGAEMELVGQWWRE
ncbi:hypothetical protein SEA_LIFES_110 [Microbacterium phage Lifes]|nr:hypothetical protein SEA_LIFES_110 [Microbacterium phage Lifes]